MKRATHTVRIVALVGVVAVAGCSRIVPGARSVGLAPNPTDRESEDAGVRDAPDRADSLAAAMAAARAAVPATPDLAQPTTTAGTRIWREAVQSKGVRILVSTEARALWLMRDTVVLLSAPVAVGMEKGFAWAGRQYDFQTPIGRRRVQSKDTVPIWTPPDWHYYEIALEKKLQLVQLKRGMRGALDDGSSIEIRGNDVGRVNQFGNFWAFTPGTEIIFDGTIYVPPLDTRQRKIPDVLGTHKLTMGDGYLIHGTNMETSIGEAVSHGCVRMFNEDVARLFALAPVGTPVYIF